MFAVNDPYLGGTHFNDVRIIRPIFHEGRIIAYAQANGHWADVGGSVPGSFDINAKEHFGEGLRIPPVRLWDRGVYRPDVGRLIFSNTRMPTDCEGDMHAQAEATRACEREILRLVGALRRRHRRDGVRRGAELRRAAHARPHRGAARRGDGDGRLPRPRPGRRRGPDPDPRQDDHLGRPRALRPERLAPGRRLVPQLGLRRHHLGRLRGHQDVLPRRAAQLGLLPRGHGRSRARGHASSTRRGRSRSPASARGRTRRS